MGSSSQVGKWCGRLKTSQHQIVCDQQAQHDLAKCFLFDGHGPVGGVVCDLVRKEFMSRLTARLCAKLQVDMLQMLSEVCLETDEACRLNWQTEINGATAIACFVHDDELLICNLGDGRAVLAVQATPSSAVSAVQLSKDHLPSRTDELKRLKAHGAVLEPVSTKHLRKVGFRVRSGACDWKGTTKSRCFGDFRVKNCGVSCEPELSLRQLSKKDRAFILGSRQVWNFVSNNEAVRIACELKDPVEAAEGIVLVARRRLERTLSSSARIEDVSAIVVRLNYPAEEDAAIEPLSSSFFNTGGSSPGASRPMSVSSAFDLDKKPSNGDMDAESQHNETGGDEAELVPEQGAGVGDDETQE